METFTRKKPASASAAPPSQTGRRTPNCCSKVGRGAAGSVSAGAAGGASIGTSAVSAAAAISSPGGALAASTAQSGSSAGAASGASLLAGPPRAASSVISRAILASASRRRRSTCATRKMAIQGRSSTASPSTTAKTVIPIIASTLPQNAALPLCRALIALARLRMERNCLRRGAGGNVQSRRLSVGLRQTAGWRNERGVSPLNPVILPASSPWRACVSTCPYPLADTD